MLTTGDAVRKLERMLKSLNDDIPSIGRMRLNSEAKAKLQQEKRDEIQALEMALSELKAAHLRIHRKPLPAA